MLSLAHRAADYEISLQALTDDRRLLQGKSKAVPRHQLGGSQACPCEITPGGSHSVPARRADNKSTSLFQGNASQRL